MSELVERLLAEAELASYLRDSGGAAPELLAEAAAEIARLQESWDIAVTDIIGGARAAAGLKDDEIAAVPSELDDPSLWMVEMVKFVDWGQSEPQWVSADNGTLLRNVVTRRICRPKVEAELTHWDLTGSILHEGSVGNCPGITCASPKVEDV